MAIKECFLLRIGSLLKFGPLYPFDLGVDLMVYNSCVEIVMEMCYAPNKVPETIQRSDPRDLFESLYLIHRLRIFHFDVKPDNIVYSL